jgi:hypothetical protein
MERVASTGSELTSTRGIQAEPDSAGGTAVHNGFHYGIFLICIVDHIYPPSPSLVHDTCLFPLPTPQLATLLFSCLFENSRFCK